jgi:CheY-like chemotaxis protein
MSWNMQMRQNESGTSFRPGVLIVEDEALIGLATVEWLAEEGFSVRLAASGEEALRVLRDDDTVDALFTDINLPGDLDGWTLAQQARELRPDLAVVYASGRWATIDEERAVKDGVFIPKPYQCERVASLLLQLIAPRRDAAAS